MTFRSCSFSVLFDGIVLGGSTRFRMEDSIIVSSNDQGRGIQVALAAAAVNIQISRSIFSGSGVTIFQDGAASTSLSISNTKFISTTTAIDWKSGNVNLVNNSFFRSQVRCSGGTFSGSMNKFCGLNALLGTCTNFNAIRPTFYSAHDFCGVCDGNNEDRTCNGCFTSGASCPTPKSKEKKKFN